MTNTDGCPNGWPNADRPGEPLNPERDGWHWTKAPSTGELVARKWNATWQGRLDGWWEGQTNASTVALSMRGWSYAGPCLTPAEAAKMRKTLEKIAARDFDCAPHQHGMAAAEYARATLANEEPDL